MSAGESEDEDRAIFESVYERLRILARAYMGHERVDHTLVPTALVHEAFLRIERDGSVDDPSQLIGRCARRMRQVLVDHARRTRAARRDGRRTTLKEAFEGGGSGFDVLELEDALQKLEQVSPEQARLVELRFFTGLEWKQIARMTGTPERTMYAQWQLARARLARELADDVGS